MPLSRREFTALTGSAMASLAFGSGCDDAAFLAQGGNGRLKARPKTGGTTTARGTSPLSLGGTRDAVLVMPSLIPTGLMPMAVMLHGAGGSAERFLQRFGTMPGDAGVAALYVDSRSQTWDGIRGGFGPDVEFLDRALAKAFELVAVDPARLAIGGFSDGATYGLSLGLINGDLFPRIVAYSPGFIVEGPMTGRPRVFISHGTADDVLPIDSCSRVIVPGLRKRGYDITFKEFQGGHEVPQTIAQEGFAFVSAAS